MLRLMLARDLDPDSAPDLSTDVWPEKFAKARVLRGHPPMVRRRASSTIRLSQGDVEDGDTLQPTVPGRPAQGRYHTVLERPAQGVIVL